MPGAYLLAYDADCGPCSRFKSAVEFLDARGEIEFTSLRKAEAEGRLDMIDPAARYMSFHLIGPGLGALSGAAAVPPLVEILLPRRAPIPEMMESFPPGLKRTISVGYAFLSRLHGVGTCRTARR